MVGVDRCCAAVLGAVLLVACRAPGHPEAAGGTGGSSGSGESSSGSSAVSRSEATTEPPETPLPAGCQGTDLPLPRGGETQAGHFTTAEAFGLYTLEQWLGERPSEDQGVLVLTSDPKYDCDELPVDIFLDPWTAFSSVVVYVFPGPIEPGTYHAPLDVRSQSVGLFGDGMGNAGTVGIAADEITIVSVEPDCVTGIKPLSDDVDYGFAVSTAPTCSSG